jgi:hypothetical protein
MASSREGWAVGHEILLSERHGILLRYREQDGWTEPFAGLEKFDAYSWRLNGVSALSTRDACAVGTVTLSGGRCKGVAFAYTLNKAPLLEPIGDKLATGGEELSFTIHATDPDGGPVTYAAFNLPPGASFDADSATFTWVAPQMGYAGIEAAFVATDAGGLSDLEVINIGAGYTLNKAPLLEPIGDKLATGGEEFTFTIHATDPDGGPITYAAFDLPPGASFDAGSATFTWVAPQLGYAGIEATFVATDADGLSDFEVVNIGAGAQLTLSVTVRSNPLWTDTGLTLTAGHQVRIVAVGTDRWTWGGLATNNAAGFLPWNKPNTHDRFLFEANHGEMIGFVGADPYQGNWGEPYYDWYDEGDPRNGQNQLPGYLHVGEQAVTADGFHGTAGEGGRLWLGFNDDAQSQAVGDNEGSVEVTIHVSGRPAE